MVVDRVEHRIGFEPRQQDRRRTHEQGAVQPDAEAVHVEERQGEHETIVGGPAPGDPHRFAARQDVAVGEHGALGRAGGPRRVAEHGEVVGFGGIEHRRLAVGEIDRGAHDDERTVGRRGEQRGAGVVVDHAGRGFAVADDVTDLAGQVGAVHRYDHQAESQRSDVGDHELDGGRRAHDDPIAGSQAGARVAAGDRARAQIELGVHEPTAGAVDRRGTGCRGPPLRPCGRQAASRQQVDRRGGHARREVTGPRRLHDAEATGTVRPSP